MLLFALFLKKKKKKKITLHLVQMFFFGFQVVRLCAKSREAVSSPVKHLTLHYQVCVGIIIVFCLILLVCPLFLAYFTFLQVRHLDTSEKSELHKLQQLEDEQGQAYSHYYFFPLFKFLLLMDRVFNLYCTIGVPFLLRCKLEQ